MVVELVKFDKTKEKSRIIMKKELERIEKELHDAPKTIFDTIKLSINGKHVGAALREDLVTLSNLYGRISQLATNSVLLLERANNRYEIVEALAWGNVDPQLKITQKKKAVRTVVVKIDGEETTLSNEESRLKIYEHVANRGKDKIKEISALLDVGRTLLSWDKQEQSKTSY